MKTEKNSQISNITKEYLEGRYSNETEEKVQQWLTCDENSEEKEEGSLEYWNTIQSNTDSSTYPALRRVLDKVGITKRKSTIPLHRRLMRIAAVLIPVLMLVGGTYYFSQREQQIHIFTAFGETKHIILPDSSEVWLNSGSNIQYLSKFKGDNRAVKLDGEAYFVVKKDTLKPFVVNTQNLAVNVLGTEFNVKAYANDSKTIATLDKGKIRVTTASDQSQILTPNEQLTYNNKTSNISVRKTHASNISAWRSGQLIFTNATFNEILQTLERDFNVLFESENIESSEQGYTIKFLKDDSLESVLNILKDVVGGFSYQIENDKIKITSKK